MSQLRTCEYCGTKYHEIHACPKFGAVQIAPGVDYAVEGGHSGCSYLALDGYCNKCGWSSGANRNVSLKELPNSAGESMLAPVWKLIQKEKKLSRLAGYMAALQQFDLIKSEEQRRQLFVEAEGKYDALKADGVDTAPEVVRGIDRLQLPLINYVESKAELKASQEIADRIKRERGRLQPDGTHTLTTTIDEMVLEGIIWARQNPR